MFFSRKAQIFITLAVIVCLFILHYMLESCWSSVACYEAQQSLMAYVPLLLVALIFSTILFFCSESAFRFWQKYNLIAVVIGVILITVTPIEEQGFIQLYPDAKTIAALGIPAMYLISYLLILIIRVVAKRVSGTMR